MRNRENPMLVTFDHLPPEERWGACLSELDCKYTLSIKKICKILKCSRTWFTRYIKPHLHYIYLANGTGRVINYVARANIALEKKGKERLTETTWYSEQEFHELIKNSITSVTRQTAIVPIESLIRPECYEGFFKEFISMDDIKNSDFGGDLEEYQRIMNARDTVIKKYATKNGKKMWVDAPNHFQRTKALATSCELDLDKIDLNDLMAVHDLKDYGDTDEEIYRELFLSGCYRLTLNIPDSDGVVSEKIYYLKDEEREKSKIEDILVKYIFVSK